MRSCGCVGASCRCIPRSNLKSSRMGVSNLNHGAPSWSFSWSLWSSQVLRAQPLGVNEKVATFDRAPSVMTARLEYLWEIMDHGKERKDLSQTNIVKRLCKICLSDACECTYNCFVADIKKIKLYFRNISLNYYFIFFSILSTNLYLYLIKWSKI